MKAAHLITEKEQQVILQTVDLFSHEGVHSVLIHLIRIFGKDISANHYIFMGHAIGTREATDLNSAQFINTYQYGQSHN